LGICFASAWYSSWSKKNLEYRIALSHVPTLCTAVVDNVNNCRKRPNNLAPFCGSSNNWEELPLFHPIFAEWNS